LSLIIPLIIFFDQYTKHIAETIYRKNPITFFIFELTYFENTGVAFGLFKDKAFMHGILSSIIVGIILIIRDYTFRKKKYCLKIDFAICMIIAGAMGNIIDRIRLGYVVDMFSIPYFAVINLADFFISFGGILLAFFILRRSNNDRKIYRYARRR